MKVLAKLADKIFGLSSQFSHWPAIGSQWAELALAWQKLGRNWANWEDNARYGSHCDVTLCANFRQFGQWPPMAFYAKSDDISVAGFAAKIWKFLQTFVAGDPGDLVKVRGSLATATFPYLQNKKI